ncbi:alpha-hydroxy-acid oxidizing protein [Roseovarius faecimaris]|uniref:Alpha-hydroxy-acid oxidizing protein n=1 Tax=Roseovarius faecimaris TaxID=2494550 RepID=A0A6I6IP85_9RHOB|nr:alpha-hydroxy acid oxidase [Roseovarius faecimaris]QGX98950.1 alpha-hydroxy-acid oxidizing protein [Roseovarius faecimaris]
MDLHTRYPALSDLRARAKRRLPHFVWEFLDSGTGRDKTKAHNREALDAIRFLPSILHGEITPNLGASLLGQDFALPVGVAPVGMSGLVWPGAERHLARMAALENIPYVLSNVASQTPEDMHGHAADGSWFQLYPPRDEDIRTDMLRRVRAAGFTTLVMTVDLPAGSRRERQARSGLTHPPRLTPRLLAQVALRPSWALGMAQQGMPRMRFIDDYSPKTKGLPVNAHVGYLLRTSPNWDYLRWVRDAWEGPMIVKGVLRAEDATRLESEGVDAIWVSNHAGRQFDAAPASITQLPQIRAATTLPLILDSGIETGLDILRAFAFGADLVMLGRGWHYALAALGAAGPAHLADILREDLKSNMGQLGLTRLKEASERLIPSTSG